MVDGYSYDHRKTAGIKPLHIDEARIKKWVENLVRPQKVKTLVVFPVEDFKFGASANLRDGTNRRFEFTLKYKYLTGGPKIEVQTRGLP